MNQKDLIKKMALLKAGQRVVIDGLLFSAKRIDVDDPWIPCTYCNVDCLCRDDVALICKELDFTSNSVWYLYLES